MKHICPNCTAPVAGHPENGCVLAALIQVLRDRGELSERRLRRVHARTNADALWGDIGRTVNDLADGQYDGGTPSTSATSAP